MHHVRAGEVDDHLGAGVGDVEQPVAVVDHRHQVEVVGRVHGLQASVPIRPRAPSTPTLMRGLAADGGAGRGRRCWSRGQASRRGPDASPGRRAPAASQLPGSETEEQAHDVGHPVAHGGVAADQPLDDLAAAA